MGAVRGPTALGSDFLLFLPARRRGTIYGRYAMQPADNSTALSHIIESMVLQSACEFTTKVGGMPDSCAHVPYGMC